MDQNELKIIVKVINEAKAGIASVEKGLDGVAKKAKSVGTGTEAAGAGMTDFVPAIAGAIVATKAFNVALQLSRQALEMFITVSKNAIQDVIKFESAMLGLTSIASKFGIGADEVTKAAMDLSADGLMPVTSSMEGLKNLLATGFSMPEAIALMEGLKDSAVFGRQGFLTVGEAVVGATQGLKNQNSVMVDNAGISKNLTNIMVEQGASRNDLSKVTSDATARGALYNGMIQETAMFEGDAEKAADTLGGQLSKLDTATQTLSTSFGFLLKPSVESMVTPIAELGQRFTEFFAENIDALDAFGAHLSQMFMLAMGDVQDSIDGVTPENVVIAMGEIVKGINKIIVSSRILYEALKLSFNVSPIGALINAVKVLQISLQTALNQLASIDLSNLGASYEEVMAIGRKGAGEMNEILQKGYIQPMVNIKQGWHTLGKIMEYDVRRSWEGAAKVSKTSAAAAGGAWEDTLKNTGNLSKDTLRKIAKENERFIEQMEKRTKAFQERLDDLIISHREKISSLRADLAEEKKALQKAVNERRRQAGKEINVIEKTADTKVAILRKEIQREIAANLENEQSNIASLEQQIRDIEEAKDREIRVVQKALDEEITLIKEKRKKRIDTIQTGLNKELQIQKKFASDFARVKNKVVEDDITRLKRKFAVETAEYRRQHVKRLNEAVAQGNAEGRAYGNGIGSGVNSSIPTISNSLKNTLGTIQQTIKESFVKMFTRGFGGGGGGGGGMRQGGAQSLTGGVTRINEAGGEIVNLPSGSQIIPAERTKDIINNNTANNQSSINVSVNATRFMGSKTEARQMALEVVEAIRSLATNRGLVPTEFLNLNQ